MFLVHTSSSCHCYCYEAWKNRWGLPKVSGTQAAWLGPEGSGQRLLQLLASSWCPAQASQLHQTLSCCCQCCHRVLAHDLGTEHKIVSVFSHRTLPEWKAHHQVGVYELNTSGLPQNHEGWKRPARSPAHCEVPVWMLTGAGMALDFLSSQPCRKHAANYPKWLPQETAACCKRDWRLLFHLRLHPLYTGTYISLCCHLLFFLKLSLPCLSAENFINNEALRVMKNVRWWRLKTGSPWYTAK